MIDEAERMYEVYEETLERIERGIRRTQRACDFMLGIIAGILICLAIIIGIT